MSEERNGLISWWDALANMPVGRASLLAMIFADTIGTGSLVIFVFWPTFFVTLDVSKLLLLSFAITGPFIAFGAFVLQAGHAAKSESHSALDLGQRIAESVGSHCLWSLLSLFVIGLQKVTPLPSVGADMGPTFAFWGYTALYVYFMMLKGAFIRYEKPWILKLFPVPLVLFAIFKGIQVAHQFGKA